MSSHTNLPLFNIPPSFSSSDELETYVQKNEGRVDPQTARRFVNAVLYSERDVDVSRAKLASLDIETKLNLYEAIASDTRQHSLELTALNESLSLGKKYFDQQAKETTAYFADTAAREKEWATMNPREMVSFADMTAMVTSDSLQLTEAQKKAYAKFVVETYSQHCGLEKAPCVQFYKGKPHSLGYQSKDEIGINLNSVAFKNEFSQVLNTTVHEGEHKVHDTLGQAYIDGKVDRDHPFYIAARVCAANLKTRHGYLSPDNAMGHGAYELQPVEKAARLAGEGAVEIARAIYCQPDGPVRLAGMGRRPGTTASLHS